MIPRLRYDVLKAVQLRRLGDHKYSCSGSSFLEPIMQKYWNWLVNKLPLTLAPNLITIAGLLVNIITSLILMAYSPDGKQDMPRWSLLLCALGLFVYQSLDAIDGKQARRTGTSSPLGELFDHGCDSMSTVFVSIAACVAVKLGTHPGWFFFQCMTAVCLFYSAHWQTYVSGTLRFAKFDVTEAQFCVMGLHLISALFGPSIWETRLPLIGLEMKLSPVIFAVSMSTFLIYNNLTCVSTGGVGKNGSTVAGTSVLSPIIPFSLVIIPSFVIYQKSISHLYENNPCLYLLAFGLVAAKVTNRLVVAHMTKSEMDYLDSVLIGPCMLFLNQYFNTAIDEYIILWLCLLWTIFDLIRYCSSVCLQICWHLHIGLFTIKPKPPGATGGPGVTTTTGVQQHNSPSRVVLNKHNIGSVPKNGSTNRKT